MKKALPFLLLLASAACKKSADSPAINDTRIQSWAVPGSISETYEYDSKNRLTKATYSGYDQNTLYTYTDSMVTERIYKTSTGAATYTFIYKLNNKGLAVSRVDTAVADDAFNYEYNTDGYLTRNEEIQPSTGHVWSDYRSHYTNNVLDSTSLYRQNVWTLGYYYQYYTDKINSLENPNYGCAFLGRQFRLPEKMVVRWSPTFTDTTRYSYNFDAKQNISQQMTLSPGATVPQTVNYTYR